MSSVTVQEPAMAGWQVRSRSSRPRTPALSCLPGTSWQPGCCVMTRRRERRSAGRNRGSKTDTCDFQLTRSRCDGRCAASSRFDGTADRLGAEPPPEVVEPVLAHGPVPARSRKYPAAGPLKGIEYRSCPGPTAIRCGGRSSSRRETENRYDPWANAAACSLFCGTGSASPVTTWTSVTKMMP